MMEFLKNACLVIVMIGVMGAFILPDWIVGVNKAMRMGHTPYPKEKKKKKWKWVGIFLGAGLVGFGLWCALEYLF